MTNISTLINDKIEIPGFILGATAGVVKANPAHDIIMTLVLAFASGLMGAIGAHLWKLIIKQLNKNKDGKEGK